MVWGLGRGNRSKLVECVIAALRLGTAAAYSEIMRGLGFRSVVGVLCVALLGSGTLSGCWDEEFDPEMSARFTAKKGNPIDECPSKQVIEVEVLQPQRGEKTYEGPLNLVLKLDINDEPVVHSSTFVKTSSTTGFFDLTVGKTLPRQIVRSGSNKLEAHVYEVFDQKTDNWTPLSDVVLTGVLNVSDCDEHPDVSSSAAPEPDNQQPVSNLKAEFHFGQTSGCPFMQAVDVAGVADNADVSLKFSIDGTPVEHTAGFITEDEYVKEGFDGYFDLVAGDNFDATLEGEHTLKVEVSDGVGSVTIEGKFTADSC